MNPDESNVPPSSGPDYSTGPDQPDTRTWNMLCHLSALSGLFTAVGFWLGPILVWVFQKDRYPSVDAHGKEAINFAITMFLYYAGASVGGFVIGVLTCGIGMFLGVAVLAVLGIAHVVLTIIASIEANSGKSYRYPYIWRPIQ